jgi:trimeric autotransporter adhesin
MKKIILIIVCVFLMNNSLKSQTWSAMGSNLTNTVYTITAYNNKIYAGVDFAYAFNGSTWVSSGTGMNSVLGSSALYALAVYNNSLFAGGFFFVLNPSNNWYNNGARLSNTVWTTCGSGTGNDEVGFSDDVYVMITYQGNLYAGGKFGDAGGTTWNPQAVYYIAKFNGTNWGPVGGGMSDRVNEFTIHNNLLIASGYFTTAGTASANYIASWNGSYWSALGSGMDYKVTALASYNGVLFAGGQFSTAGGVPATNIAKWNGSSWSSAGTELASGQVNSLCVYNGLLYAGGDFHNIGSNEPNYIAVWNGNGWSSVGSGTNGTVIILYANNGSLYVGGNFTQAGGTSVNNIAKYNTSVNVNNISSGIPENFSLKQNYPNPFNPQTKIGFEIPKSSPVKLIVYDITGKELITLVDENLQAGVYETEWNASSFSSGTYFCKMIAGDYVQIKKLSLIK